MILRKREQVIHKSNNKYVSSTRHKIYCLDKIDRYMDKHRQSIRVTQM